MRKRLLATAAVVGLAVGGGVLGLQPANAACEGHNGGDPDRDGPQGNGNEAAAVYVGPVPVEAEVNGIGVRTDEVWVEVQDDGEHAPANVEVGWSGKAHFLNGVVGCSDVFLGENLPQ